jgi:hypothetical protein
LIASLVFPGRQLLFAIQERMSGDGLADSHATTVLDSHHQIAARCEKAG